MWSYDQTDTHTPTQLVWVVRVEVTFPVQDLVGDGSRGVSVEGGVVGVVCGV